MDVLHAAADARDARETKGTVSQVNTEQNELDPRDSYITLDRKGESIYTDKRSVFHSFAAPVNGEIEAYQYLSEAKNRYPDAVHHVYAWIIGGTEKRNKYSDDGEPSGTAGLPVLDILRKRGIEDAVVIVSRYFGGTLLGTGGLVRAYSGAAAAAVDEAVPVTMISSSEFFCVSAYPEFEKIRQAVKEAGVIMTDPVYGSDVRYGLSVPKADTDKMIRLINDLTCGKIMLEFKGTGFIRSA